MTNVTQYANLSTMDECYTSKVMILIDDYDRLLKIKMNRVKPLKGRSGYWVTSSRSKDIKYYGDDPVIFLKGIGKKTSQQLEEIGIKVIAELKQMEFPIQHDNLPKSLTIKKLTQFRNEAQLASNDVSLHLIQIIDGYIVTTER